jgi:hypothetical protein
MGALAPCGACVEFLVVDGTAEAMPFPNTNQKHELDSGRARLSRARISVINEDIGFSHCGAGLVELRSTWTGARPHVSFRDFC